MNTKKDLLKKLENNAKYIEYTIDELRKSKGSIMKKIEKLSIELCSKHEMKYGGHGHNDDYYKCEHCPYSEWR